MHGKSSLGHLQSSVCKMSFQKAERAAGVCVKDHEIKTIAFVSALFIQAV